MSEGLSAQKKTPIWELFFASQFLWPQHFLHSITDDIYGPIYKLNNKTSKKINKLSLLANYYRQLP